MEEGFEMSDQNRNLGIGNETVREGLHLCYLYSYIPPKQALEGKLAT